MKKFLTADEDIPPFVVQTMNPNRIIHGGSITRPKELNRARLNRWPRKAIHMLTQLNA